MGTAGARSGWDLEVLFDEGLAGTDAGDEGLQDSVAEAGIFGAWYQVVGFSRGHWGDFRVTGRYDDEGVF